MKKLQHLIEAASVELLFGLLRLLPLDMASALGGWLGRTIGPCLSAHRTAQQNLALIMAELSAEERATIISGMWDNLGRVAAEFPHLPGKTLTSRITLYGEENLPKQGEAALFFSGHLGNWELLPSIPYRRNLGITIIYRHANNPYVDGIIARLRASQSDAMVAKGPRGAFKLAKALKKKQSLCMLVDQKMNDGIALPFFGHQAMTAPAIAQLSLRYGLPIIPTRVIRTGGAYFDVIIYPPLLCEKTGDDEKDIVGLMTAINAMLSTWIREKPEQWFWVHKRWRV